MEWILRVLPNLPTSPSQKNTTSVILKQCILSFNVGILLSTTSDSVSSDEFDGKESASRAGYLGSIPGLGRAPGEGNGNPLQNSCLENSMDRGAWQGLQRVGLD